MFAACPKWLNREEENKVMFKTSTWILLAISILLSGCNTVKGIGRDIERGGEAIQKATH